MNSPPKVGSLRPFVLFSLILIVLGWVTGCGGGGDAAPTTPVGVGGSASTTPVAPSLSITEAHTGNFTQGQQGATDTVTVSNGASAGPTTGQVTVTATVPSGLTLALMGGMGWSCSSNTCTRSDVLNAGASYPSITVTVNVASNASSPQVNQVSVSGGGSATASANDSTTIAANSTAPANPLLGIAKTHTGNFTQGQQGAAYTVTVSNAGSAAATSGAVTVTETVPSGLTLVSIAGVGWNCATNICTRSDSLNAGFSYSPITVTVNVAANATSPQVNQVSVSGGGSATASASDSTTIAANSTAPANPLLSVAKTHTGDFTQGQQGATYTVTVSNAAGAAATSGAVTVTETVPSGLTLVSMAGVGWNCVTSTCTRSDSLNASSGYSPITVTVNVAANATSPQVNQVSVSGGGSATANTSDSTRIIVVSGGGASAQFVSQDTTTQGNWQSMYGADGYSVADSVQSLPTYDPSFAVQNQLNTIWNGNTTDPRALKVPGAGSGIASTWYNNVSFSFDIDFSDGKSHQLAFYAVDWDNQQRSETIRIADASTNALLDTRTLSNFYNGAYLVWDITGSVTITVTTASGPNAVISGVFFGPGSGGGSIPAYYNPNPPCPSSGIGYPVAINSTWTVVGCAAEFGNNEGAGSGCTNLNAYTEVCGMDHDAPVNVNDLILLFDDEDGLAAPTTNPNLACTDNFGGTFIVAPITQSDGTPWWAVPGTGGSLSGNLLYHTMTTNVPSGYRVACTNNSSGNFIDNSMMVLRKADGTAFSGFDSNSTHWIVATTPSSGCDVTPCLLQVAGSTFTWSLAASTSGELIFWAGNSEGTPTAAFAQPVYLDGDGVLGTPYFTTATTASSGTVTTTGLDIGNSDTGAWALVGLKP